MSRNRILFSFVIPTYNRADFLSATITSLLNQTYDNFEIIVVDDGSTDHTEKVISEIKSEKLFYFKKNNEERGAARNFGARLAKGGYVNFFDSDDIAYSNHLSEAISAITALDTPEVFHLAYDIKSADGKLQRRVDVLPTTINESLIMGNHLSCNGVFIRKDIALAFPFSERRQLSASEDYALWLKLSSRFPIHCRKVITSSVIDHDQRSVIQINKSKLLARLLALEEEVMNDAEFKSKYKPNLGSFKAFLQVYIALHLALTGNSRMENIGYLWQAVKYKPTVLFTYRFLAALKNIIL